VASLVDQVTPVSDTLWKELSLFLRENAMTMERSFPITARESVSLLDAYSLYQKSAMLLKEVNRRGSQRFPHVASGWWVSRNIEPMIRREFRDHARLTLSLWGRSRIGLLFGLIGNELGETMYTVRVEADPRIGEARARMHAIAEREHLVNHGWILEFDAWPLLTARAHTVNHPSLDSAVAWFIDRFEELDGAGVFALQAAMVGDAGEPTPLTDTGADE
jgi:hypothetical protein